MIPFTTDKRKTISGLCLFHDHVGRIVYSIQADGFRLGNLQRDYPGLSVCGIEGNDTSIFFYHFELSFLPGLKWPKSLELFSVVGVDFIRNFKTVIMRNVKIICIFAEQRVGVEVRKFGPGHRAIDGQEAVGPGHPVNPVVVLDLGADERRLVRRRRQGHGAGHGLYFRRLLRLGGRNGSRPAGQFPERRQELLFGREFGMLESQLQKPAGA